LSYGRKCLRPRRLPAPRRHCLRPGRDVEPLVLDTRFARSGCLISTPTKAKPAQTLSPSEAMESTAMESTAMEQDSRLPR